MNKAMDRVKKARLTSRPTTLEFIEQIFDEFIELHGDRSYGDDPAVVGGIASIAETAFTVIGIQKGHSMEENIRTNFGQPHPEGYRKELRLLKQAEKFNRNVVLFVNTPGAFPGVGAEERGQSEAIAHVLMELSGLKVPILSIFIGEGGSGGALAFALADRVWMLENGMYAVLSPEGFSSILWRTPSRVEEAAELMKLTATDLLKNQVIDRIIPEAREGIENNFSFTTDKMKSLILKEFEVLRSRSIEELLLRRYKRFRKYGEHAEEKV